MRRRTCLTGLATIPLWTSGARAQAFPERPVTLVNGYPPGGSTDIAARLVSDGMMRNLSGRVIVENRPGASGTVAAEWLKRQPADGYTLLVSESSSFAIWPAMHVEGMKYDPLRDFDWISVVCTSPMVFLVAPDFPAKTLPEALDVLRSPKAADMNYSSSGAGSIPHIGSELLRLEVGKNGSRHVHYRGGAPAVLAISKGEVAWGVASLGSAAGLMQGGAVRALAMTSAKRFPAFPDVPTFNEAGLPGMELEIYYLAHAPAGLPKPVLGKLSEAIVKSLGDATARERFLKAGMQAYEGENTPQATRTIVEQENRRFRDIAARTGIKIIG